RLRGRLARRGRVGGGCKGLLLRFLRRFLGRLRFHERRSFRRRWGRRRGKIDQGKLGRRILRRKRRSEHAAKRGQRIADDEMEKKRDQDSPSELPSLFSLFRHLVECSYGLKILCACNQRNHIAVRRA